MPYLKFNTTESRYTDYQFKPLTEHLIQINGIKEYTLTGFKLYTDNDKVFGDYSDYIYPYHKDGLDEYSHIYSNNRGYLITFKLDNKIINEQYVLKYEDVKEPTVSKSGCRFVRWDIDIPKFGEITKDIVVNAIMEKVPTLAEAREKKSKELSEICKSTIIAKHTVKLTNKDDVFNYSEINQLNISNAFAVAIVAMQRGLKNMVIPLYNADNICETFSCQDILKIYVAMQTVITYNLTLCHQLQEQILSMKKLDDIESIQYNENYLSGDYKVNFNAILEQANKMAESLLYVPTEKESPAQIKDGDSE